MQFQITLSGKNKKYNNVKDQDDLLLRPFYWKNMKTVSLCSPVFLCTRHKAKLRREVTPPIKNIKKKR